MTYLSQAAEAALAEMTPSEVTALLARVRPGIEQSDPIDQAEAELSARANAKKNRAAAVLRHTRGLDRTTPATKEHAAAALASYKFGN